jgi:hypothetical protein
MVELDDIAAGEHCLFGLSRIWVSSPPIGTKHAVHRHTSQAPGVDPAGRVRRCRGRARRVHRRGHPPPPAGRFRARRRPVPAGQPAEERVLVADAPTELPEPARHDHRANTPWPRSSLAGNLSGAPINVPPPIHRAAEPPGSGHAQAPGGPSHAGPHPRPEDRSTGPQSGSGCCWRPGSCPGPRGGSVTPG